MKKLSFLLAVVCMHHFAQAQEQQEERKKDTIRIGDLLIINTKGKHVRDTSGHRHALRKTKPGNVHQTWFNFDIGLTNYTDNTDYGSTAAQQFAPGANRDWFKLRSGKSVNLNIWVFTQRINLIRHVVNLRYSAGLELNNYHYKDEIRFRKNPTLVYKDQIIYRKNKLAADYITIPLMLDFNFTPKTMAYKRSFGLSVGASAGYLYSARQKYISDETGKEKLKDDFDLRSFKISYVAELHLGPVKLYGSLATRSMFEKGLDQTPYTMGLRFDKF